MVAGRALVRPSLSLHQQQGRPARQDDFDHLISTQKPGTEAGEACEDTPASLGEESPVAGVSVAALQALRCLGLTRKVDMKAKGPVSILPGPGDSACLFLEGARSC